MKKFLLGLLLALAFLPAFADYAYSTKDVAIIAKENQACSPQVLNLLTDEAKQFSWKAAEILFQGRKIQACWALVDDKVVIVDEEGDGGFIDPAAFRKLKEV